MLDWMRLAVKSVFVGLGMILQFLRRSLAWLLLFCFAAAALALAAWLARYLLRHRGRLLGVTADATRLRHWLGGQGLRLMKWTATNRVYTPVAPARSSGASTSDYTVIWLHGVGQSYELECICGDSCAPMNGLAKLLAAGRLGPRPASSRSGGGATVLAPAAPGRFLSGEELSGVPLRAWYDLHVRKPQTRLRTS